MPDTAAAGQGRARQGSSTVRKASLRGMVALRGDLASASLKNVVKKITGIGIPGQGEAGFADGYGILWMSPDELLIFCPYGEAANAVSAIETALSGAHVLAADVSDMRTEFTVSGAAAREVLAKLTPADVSPDAFRPGMVRRSRLAQVPAAFWLEDDETFAVICFRSVARYMFDLLSSAAAPGSEVEYFQNSA